VTKDPAPAREQVEFVGLKLLDDLIKNSFESVRKEFESKPKLGDWLKMLEMRAKLSPKDASHRELWRLLEEVRREVLPAESGKQAKPEAKRRTKPRSKKANAKAKA
jgi:hypothetical protein